MRGRLAAAQGAADRATFRIGMQRRVLPGGRRPARRPPRDHPLGCGGAAGGRYPAVIVDADAIHVSDGRLSTAAGVTAGLDLALALVEEDLGHEIAMQVASQLVMFFKRPGGQMQFSRKGEAVPAGRSALQEVQRWVAANPGARP